MYVSATKFVTDTPQLGAKGNEGQAPNIKNYYHGLTELTPNEVIKLFTPWYIFICQK